MERKHEIWTLMAVIAFFALFGWASSLVEDPAPEDVVAQQHMDFIRANQVPADTAIGEMAVEDR